MLRTPVATIALVAIADGRGLPWVDIVAGVLLVQVGRRDFATLRLRSAIESLMTIRDRPPCFASCRY